MDFGIRELLFLIGAILFVGLTVDGLRRFLDNRKKQIKLEVKAHQGDETEEADIDWYAAELPNGGARSKPKENLNQSFQAERKQSVSNTQKQSRQENKFTEPFDILMEGGRHQSAVAKEEPKLATGSFAVDEQEDEVPSITYRKDDDFSERNASQSKNNQPTIREKKSDKPINQGDLFQRAETESDLVMGKAARNLPEEIIAINVMARSNGDIGGAALLEAVLSFGLRFGDMNIFHRHENASGQGAVIFSMASALNPGSFDLNEMPNQTFKGVTFFMRLSQLKKRVFVLELMVDIAKRLANQVDGELRDDTHSVLSSQTITHYKTRIQEYERRYLGQVLRSDN